MEAPSICISANGSQIDNVTSNYAISLISCRNKNIGSESYVLRVYLGTQYVTYTNTREFQTNTNTNHRISISSKSFPDISRKSCIELILRDEGTYLFSETFEGGRVIRFLW